LKLVPQLPPENPAEGWLYADSATHGLFFYNGTAWTQPYTSAANVLTALQGVDGLGSGLDTDLVRGTAPSVLGLALLGSADASAARTALGVPSNDSPAFVTASTVTGTQPTQLLTENVGGHSAAISFTANPDDPAWRYLILGNNLKATPSQGFAPIENGPAWGFALENNFTNGQGFSNHEFYLMDGASNRPFALNWAQPEGGDEVGIVTGIVGGLVTCTHHHFLSLGKQFQFTTLNGASGLSTGTDYFVLTTPSPTTFTFSPARGGSAETGSATSGVWRRGGHGLGYYHVPLLVQAGDYRDAPYGQATLTVKNARASTPTMLLLDNAGAGAGKHTVLQMGYPGFTLEYDPAGTGDNVVLMRSAGMGSFIWRDATNKVGIGIDNTSGLVLGAEV